MLKSIFKVGLLPLLVAVFFSCKDNHVHEPHEDHFEAEGMAFFQSGNKIAEIFRGITSDTLFAIVNQETPHTEIKFYDKDKKLLNPPDYKKNPMSWQIGDTSFVRLKQIAGEEGSYKFQLVGKRVGVTNIEFFITHAGHSDFRSGKIPIRVK
ncbi:MAG: hypothetical protein NZM09_03765 [Ignavibacterium sp.]|nr:hypothetical protein [Ignavibacterium sp.]MDW8374797.1 hypothetical protein [Ignavibacteriales bacterium]